MDCGAACLGMICRHFGRDVSLSHIRQLCHTSRDGTSLKAICHAATELGLAARALKVSLRNLSEMPLPAIVHWEGNHWMVLVDVGAIARARGRSGARRPAHFPGGIRGEVVRLRGALRLHGGVRAGAGRPDPRCAWLAPFLRKHRGVLLQALLLAVVVTMLQLLFPVFTQVVVDTVIVENDVALLTDHPHRDGRHARLHAAGQPGAGIPPQLRRRAHRRRDPGFPHAAAAVAAAALLQQPANRRHPAAAGRRAAGAPVRRAARDRRTPVASHARRRRRLDGRLQPAAGGGVPGDLAALRRHDVVLGQGPATRCSRTSRRARGSTRPIRSTRSRASRRSRRPRASWRSATRCSTSFSRVSRKMFRANFILMSYDSVLQTIGLVSTALFLWIGATRVMDGQMTVGAFVAFSSLTTMASAGILRTLGHLGPVPAGLGAAEPAERHLRTGA